MNDSVPEKEIELTPEKIEAYVKEFWATCDQRMEEGAKEYGQFAFLENDLFQFIYEELMDLANYALMKYMKLRVLEEEMKGASSTDSAFRPAGQDPKHGVSSGIGSFTPSREVL